MRAPRFGIRFLFVLIATVAIGLYWYTMPTLHERLVEGIPVASGSKLQRLLKRFPEVVLDERLDLLELLADRCDDEAAHERLRKAGYDWASERPDEFDAWMNRTFAKAAWGDEKFTFYGDGFPDPIVRGAIECLCENDDLVRAYRILDNDYEWDDGANEYPFQPLKDALAKKTFTELVTFFESQRNSYYLVDALWGCETLLVEKDLDAYVAMMPQVVSRWQKRWFDMVSTRALAKAHPQRCRQLLADQLPKSVTSLWYMPSERYHWLAKGWGSEDPYEYAAWAEQQSEEDRVWLAAMINAWPEDDLPALQNWLWENPQHLFAHSDAGYLIKRLSKQDAIAFAEKMLRRVDDCNVSTIQDIFRWLFEVDPNLANEQLDAAIARTIEKNGNTDNPTLDVLSQCQP